MKNLFTSFAMVLILMVSGTVFSQTKTWTGATSTAWSTTTNWSPSGVPAVSDNVTIPSAPANQPLINGTTTAVCNSLTVNSGATLTINGTASANAQLSVAGTATCNGALSIGGYITKTGKLITGNIVWNSTSSISPYYGGRIEVSGNWTFASGSSIVMGLCSVTFTGTGTSNIYNYSANSKFGSLTLAKTSTADTYIAAVSNATMQTESLTINANNTLSGAANITTILTGSLVNSGNISMSQGTLSFEKTSGTQIVQLNTNDTFNSININTGGTVEVSSSPNYLIQLKGSMTIQSGIFNPGSANISIWGNWTNNVGPAGFVEGTGVVGFNGGNYHQYCSNENFYKIELNKTLGGSLRMNGTTVTCAQYYWAAGAVDVLDGGTFTANDLTNDAIVGSFYCNSGCTINLTNYGGNIDLRGNLYIYYGTVNVYGGINPSWWPYQGNASLTMTGGILNFADQGILIRTDPTYTFTNSITGGTIKTTGNFSSGRSDFAPTAGIVELYGSSDAALAISAGNLFNLTINKESAKTITLSSNATITGDLKVNSGTFSATNKTITLAKELNINSGGTLHLATGTQLKLASGQYLMVNNGGLLKCEGTGADAVNITHSAGYYFLQVQNGGTLSAKYTYFEYLYNVYLKSGSTLDPANAFYRCTFTNNVGAPLAAVLSFENAQVVTIYEANFPILNSGYNVHKPNDAGRVTFKDATGAYAGAAYENDPYNRIDWTVTQPGLWAGTVSTDWWTSANWDDGNVPNNVTDFTIPATAPYMPTIGEGVFNCKSLTINGTLTFGGGDLYVSQNTTINGALVMNAASLFAVQGDIVWNSGSMANITHVDAEIDAYGHWDFNAGANASLANGTVFFLGSSTKWIRSYSANCSFYNLRSQKTGGAQIGFSDLSSEDLKINGYLLIYTGSKFVSDSPADIFIKGNITTQGTFQCNDGVVWLDGVNQSITPGVNDYFNTLIFSQTGTVNIISTYTNTVTIKGNLHIDSGIFNAGSSIIKIAGYWDNNLGSAAFLEGTSRVIFNGGNYHQYCYMDETFYALEVDKPLGGALRLCEGNVGSTVACSTYDWTAGALDAMNGNFTALNFTDNGIAGNFYVNEGGSITLGSVGSNPQLKGNITITGGTFNIIAAIESQWPGNGNASITMSGGELNVYPYGIDIANNAPYTFITNITGGKIRTEGHFFNDRSDFNPTGGTIELYGSNDAQFQMNAGSAYNLFIDKVSSKTVTLASNVTVNGYLTVNSGTFSGTNKTITLAKELNINSGGTLHLATGTQLKLATSKYLKVNNGGLLKCEGTGADAVNITHSAGYYFLLVNGGGTISAKSTTFQYMNNINLQNGSTIDPANSFYNCTFANNSGNYASFLIIGNEQDIDIRKASFPSKNATYTVSKPNNAGHINFIDATGAYAGAAYENDPYNRIDWTVTQPGLWTGTVSTDWYTAANWDDLAVPTALTDVTIPTGVSNMPLISSGTASCKNLTLNGSLVIGNAKLQVAEKMAIAGNLAMNVVSGQIIVQGDIDWNAGSTANITAEVQINTYGNWNFNAGANANLADGIITFMGSVNTWIRCYSANCSFRHIYIQNYSGAKVGFSDLSTEDLKINGILFIYPGSKFVSDCTKDIIVKGDLSSRGTFEFNAGTLKLDGGNQSITPNVNDYFNNLVFSQTGTVNIISTHTGIITVKGDLHIDSGILNAGNSIFKVGGNWDNNVGTAAFVEGTSQVIFNGGDYHQYCYMDETFYSLEINKPLGGALRLCEGNVGSTVVCGEYNWTAGALDAMNGSFTATGLADNEISGNFYVNVGGSITLGNYGSNPQLKGNITITGGTFNVIAAIESQWPGNGNASITMSGGELNVYPYGIDIVNNAPYTFNTNITGGKIRTEGHFFNDRSDFNPTGGTIELYGSNDAQFQMNAGSAYNLTIDKASSKIVTLASNVTINGDLKVNSGTLSGTNKTITLAKELNINTGGTLHLATGTQLKLASGKYLNVNNGGLLKCEGTGADAVNITHSAGYYFLSVKNGGTLSAKHTYFQYLNYVQMMSGSTLDPANAFYRCTFTNNVGAPLGAVLSFANDQVVTIYEANFPILNSGYNVHKPNDAGRVTFKDATGAYAGAAYENDPYNRIDWTATQPGLWTGTVSPNWFTSANWDDGNVPNTVTDVTIPATAPYMPNIGSGIAFSKSVTVNGTLTLGVADLNVVQNATFNGTLAMNNAFAELNVQGDIDWNSGSTANITADAQIHVYGHWNFNAGANANLANGTVFFEGSVNKWIRSYSANCSFYNLGSQKTGGAQTGVSDFSTEDLKINGNLLTFTGAKFVSDSPADIYIKGNITSQGTFQCNDGVVWLDGVNQSITPGVNDYFNSIVFSQTGTVNIINTYTNTVTIKGNLHIDSGIFDAGSSTIKVGGDWDNNVGTEAFVEGTSRVIFNGGNYHQYCYMDETFYTLEINKPLGGALRLCEGNVGSIVVCDTYDWTAGALDAMNGSFTATNLTDNGIAGKFYVNEGGSITLGNYGSNPQLKGNITMTGGTFNIIAAIESQWPGNGNASITMSGGELNVYPYGIEIVDNPPYTLTTNITGGKIRTEGHFINSRSDFNLIAGTIELYGSEDANIQMTAGGIYNFNVNKANNVLVNVTSNISISGETNITGGIMKLLPDVVLTAYNHTHVLENGTLWITEGANMKVKHAHELVINGGTLKVLGTPSNLASITRLDNSGNVNLAIYDGGSISASNAYFSGLLHGPWVQETGWVDLANAFTNCKFENGIYNLLRIENSQDLVINDAHFPSVTAPYNVRKLIDLGTVTFVNATGTFSGSAFEDDPFNRIFWGEELAQQIISIPAGWSGISSYIIPNDAAVANIFAPVQNQLVILQNFDGMYWPTTGVNTLGNWDDHSGYQIKMQTTQQVTFSGTIQDNLTANLDAGWNYLPALNACNNAVVALFSPIIGHLQIAKEIAGTGVYWPQYGINTIGELTPGKAYFVLVNDNVNLEFPACKATDLKDGQTRASDETPTGLGLQRTPLTHTIAIPLQAIAGIAEGSIITIYNQMGLCCGAAIFHDQSLVLTAFGDDPTTPAIDGMTEGEAMHFRILTPETGKEFTLEVVFDEQLPQGRNFVSHGISAIKELKVTGVDEAGESRFNVSVYPNPSTGVFHVKTLSGIKPSSEMSWEISNTHGAGIAKGNNSSDDFTIDLSTYPKGIYYLKITQRGWQTVEKLVVR